MFLEFQTAVLLVSVAILTVLSVYMLMHTDVH